MAEVEVEFLQEEKSYAVDYKGSERKREDGQGKNRL